MSDNNAPDMWAAAIQATVKSEIDKAREHDEANLQELQKQATAQKKTNKRLKRLIAALLVIVAALIYPVGESYYHDLAHPLANQLNNELINNCNTGNANRLEQINLWESYQQLQSNENKANAALTGELIIALTNGDKARIMKIDQILVASAKIDAKENAQFIEQVKKTNAPKNCEKAYPLTKPGGIR